MNRFKHTYISEGHFIATILTTKSYNLQFLLIVYFVEVNRLSYIIWFYEEGVTRVLFFPSLQLPNRREHDPPWQFYHMDEDCIGETINGDNDQSIISVSLSAIYYIFICIPTKFVLLQKQCLMLYLGLA
jgi:hypothetical protein